MFIHVDHGIIESDSELINVLLKIELKKEVDLVNDFVQPTSNAIHRVVE